jgi:hypothetical protein
MTTAPLGQETEEKAQAEIRRILRQAEIAYRVFILCCLLIGATVLGGLVWLWVM